MDFGPARTTIELSPFNEWRVETAKNSKLSLKLESGMAEIFGTELSPNITYQFKESTKIAVATYQGCTLSYSTTVPLDSDYISEETTLKQVLNLHLGLENFSMNSKRPKVLIIGPKDYGKTSLARTLAAYSLKTSEKQPILVNLNPQLPHFAIPSQLTAAKLCDLLDVETFTMGESLTTGPGTGIYRSQVPLVKNFGLENFNENLELYKCLIFELSAEVNAKILASPTDSGTVIIDTPPLNVSDWKTIQHIVDSFQVNILLVVGNERLLVDLRKKLTLDNDFVMIKMPRSSGCVEKEAKYERDLQQRTIKQYFYGVERSQLNPYTFHCSIKDFIFLKPSESDGINNEFLDFMNGDADDENPTTYPKVEYDNNGIDDDDYDPLSQGSKPQTQTNVEKNWKYNKMFKRITDPKETDLMNVIAAIIDDKDIDLNKILSNKTNLDDNQKIIELSKHVTRKSVLGFCYISGCDDSNGKLKLLIPSPVKSIPGKILIITQMRYHE
jgi:polyribonucleotide 5'-hydroxyl-kinase